MRGFVESRGDKVCVDDSDSGGDKVCVENFSAGGQIVVSLTEHINSKANHKHTHNYRKGLQFLVRPMLVKKAP